jgi:putative transcriptional regulator
MPRHHPSDEFLLDYADGSLSEAEALLIATHLALCPNCRLTVTRLEAVGGALLEEVEPEPLSPNCLEALMARLDEPSDWKPGEPAQLDRLPADVILLPEPLRSYVGAPVSALAWQPVMRGLEELNLGVGRGAVKTRLMRMRAGLSMPRHSHEGHEMVLVLDGGFRDDRGQYRRGDVLIDDSSVDHQPRADAGHDCLCLVVTNAPLRLTGRFGRFIAPFVRF